jgi:hypothetical protein
LIYFIFRYDTYVVSSVFTCLMIIGGLAAGVRILLKKDHQDTIFLKINNSREIHKNSYNIRRRKYPEAGGERSSRVGSPPRGASPPLAAPPCGEAALAHYCHRPLAYIVVPKNLSEGGHQR